jgi:AAA15 family ATPase/GTPase
MSIEKLEIEGFRGFSRSENLPFAVPNDRSGSGLTIITGANNSGKSTIVETLGSFWTPGPQFHSRGQKQAY